MLAGHKSIRKIIASVQYVRSHLLPAFWSREASGPVLLVAILVGIALLAGVVVALLWAPRGRRIAIGEALLLGP